MLFASIFVPHFFLQALFTQRPEFRSRPIALIDGTPPLLRVIAVNESGSKAGVEVGQMKAQAEAVGVLTIDRSAEYEEHAHALLLNCAREFSPRVQDKAGDLIVLDIEGLGTLFGSSEQIAKKIHSALTRQRLVVNIGIAANPDSAMLAARGSDGITIISHMKQLGSLPITLLNPGGDVLETLTLWGITNLNRLASLDSKALSQRLGQEGVMLQRLARGEQVNPFFPDEEKLEFRERSELEYPVDLLDSLSFVIASMLERICSSLEEHSLTTNELQYEFVLDAPRVSRQSLSEELTCHRRTIKLSSPTTDRGLLLRHIQLDIQAYPPAAPVEKVFLRAEAVRSRHMQLGLFAPQTPDPAKLDLLTARLSNLVGSDQVGSFQIVDSHRPRAFVMGTFEPNKRTQKDKRNRQFLRMALRLYEPPKKARIRLRADNPVQVSFEGRNGQVIEHSEAWLSSGEWWNELVYNRKEWDVELQFADGARGKFLIFIDLFTKEPFVDGSYD